jgi:hypothetical protein
MFLHASLLGVSADICQKALVGESGTIRNQMGMHSAWDALYSTTL